LVGGKKGRGRFPKSHTPKLRRCDKTFRTPQAKTMGTSKEKIFMNAILEAVTGTRKHFNSDLPSAWEEGDGTSDNVDKTYNKGASLNDSLEVNQGGRRN